MSGYYPPPQPHYDPYAAPYGVPPGPYGGAPPPQHGYPPSAAPQYDPSGEELRTIFITGFPNDMKDRELSNMLRFVPGFQDCQLSWKNNQAQGFALFDSGASAAAACSLIAHVQFDENSVLRTEIARKNMFIKGDGPGGSKRMRFNGGFSGQSTWSGPSAPSMQPVQAVQPQGFVPVNNVNDNPPCNTLFVGNVGDRVNEAELRGLFGTQPGFRNLKVVVNSRGATCFVEFHDVASATQVHDSLQGAVLASSDRGGIRIQYSKNPFGKRRADGTYQD